MEIERKWDVTGWPQADLPLLLEQSMRQGYISLRPTVRIREEAAKGGETKYILCVKSVSRDGGLSRKEIEIEIPEQKFAELEDLIGLPLIPKVRRTYQLPDGHHLEVNHVDQGLKTEFWYAEIEYGSAAEARAWDASTVGLGEYLAEDVTGQKGSTMGEYWEMTRLGKSS